MKKILFAFVMLCVVSIARADSPLTSTFFCEAYADVPFIKDALKWRSERNMTQLALSSQHLKFFDDPAISLDQKIALVNVLGWGESGNINLMKKHLAGKYKLPTAALDSILQEPLYQEAEFYAPAKIISNDDLTLLAYVQIMHDYFHPIIGFQCAHRAVLQNPESEATAYVLALLIAQNYLDMNWCTLYETMITVRDYTTFTKDRMRPEAVAIIFNYIDAYKQSCEENHDELEYTENIDEGEMQSSNIYTMEHWKKNSVYTPPSTSQVSDKKNKVDLVLLNVDDEEKTMFDKWIFLDDTSDGTRLVVSIKNKGNVASVETNLLIEIDYPSELNPSGKLFVQEKIPVIAPGKDINIEVILKDYWIYNPNADFIIKLDYDDNIIELNEENNMREFHEWG